MMKKILTTILFIIVSCFILHTSYFTTFAQEEPTPTPQKKQQTTPTEKPESSIKSKVDEIKEKIASTVAQLNLVSKRAFVGHITKIEESQITIEKNKETSIVDVDELTKYTSVASKKRTETKFSDLTVGDTIIAIGLYNKESRRLLARVILVKEIPTNINGVVREVDIKGGTIKVEDKKREKTFIVDIEKTTKITNYTKEGGLVKFGISKIEIGQRAHVNGETNGQEENRITASRVLLLPGKAIGITQEKPKEATPSPTTATPTKKLIPTKSGPTPSPTGETEP